MRCAIYDRFCNPQTLPRIGQRFIPCINDRPIELHPLKKIIVDIIGTLTDLENKKLKLCEIRDVRSDLVPGVLGILEPDSSKAKEARADEVEVIAVPGLAFDKKKNRLGRGAGYYDRFLAGLPPGAFKVALAFSFLPGFSRNSLRGPRPSRG